MKKSIAYQVMVYIRRTGTVTTKQVREALGLEQKVASACLCDLRIRGLLRIAGTRQMNATGRPVNLWGIA